MIKCGLLTMVVAMVLAVPAAQSADLPGQLEVEFDPEVVCVF